jgi:hypothetical protein
MKRTLELFESTTGWTASTDAQIVGINHNKSLIAGDLSGSLILKFDGIGSYAEKLFSTPISTNGYSDIVIWVWGRTHRKNEYRTKDDFSYKISFGTNKDFYLPCFDSFGSVVFSTNGISSVDKIRITALTDTTDYLVLSYGLLTTDDLPLDIFVGVKEKMEYLISQTIINDFLIGQISGSVNDTSIVFSGDVPWIDRYTTIMITGKDSQDVMHTEYHTIQERNGLSFTFNSTRDGSKLKYGYVNANVYLYFPVNYGRRQTEIELPSITLWSLEPEKIFLDSQLDTIIDTWNVAGSVMERTDGHYIKYSLLIDCEARQDELLAVMGNIVKRTIGQRSFYCIGRKVDLEFNGRARELEPTEAFDIVPKVQFIADIVVKEEIYDRESVGITSDVNVSVYL